MGRVMCVHVCEGVAKARRKRDLIMVGMDVNGCFSSFSSASYGNPFTAK